MIGEATTVESSPAGIDGDGFDVFSSLRSGAESDNFSSGAGEAGGADTDEAASSLDLVAVASGEAELNTVTNSKPESKETSAPVNPEQCQKYGTIACIGCGLRQFCEERQAAMMADNTELQPGEQLSTLEQLLREDDAPGEIVWARPLPDDFDGGELPIADSPRVIETSADKTDGSTEKITPQEQESKASTSEPVGTSGEDMDTEAAEAPFFGLKMAPETIADDIKDVGESRPESASEVPVNTSGKEQFTEPTEENRPSIEIKQQTPAIISDAVDKENQQPVFQSPDIPTQTKTKTVPSSPAVSEDIQTGDESCNPLENETVYPTASEDKVAASVVENTYDGDETTAPSSVKTPSIERQKEKVFVITGSESANSEPSRAAENDESATPVSEQQQLAAQFDAVKADEPAATDLIDNSGTKASTDAQPSEISIDAAPDYNNFVESTDGVDVEQPKHVIPTASNVSPYQEQEDAVNVSAEYETNETSTEKIVNAAESIPAKEQPDQPVIVSLSAQDIVEYGEDNEAWAEEDMVFFVEQQAPSSVELNVSSAEMVTIALSMEATTVREEVDDLKPSVDDEISVDMDSAGQLDNSKAVSVPEVTNDYEPVEQIVIPISPAVELIPDVELDEPVVEILEERIMPREERDNIVMKASEKSDLLCLDAEVETITMDTSGIESVVDLSEAQAELAAAEVSEAVESEVDEQNDLAVDSYGYNSEMSAVSDNVLVVKSRPSPGLWPDDSQLNPEEEFTTTTQSSADDSSLVSRLVGMFVVAMCVVRGRQSVKV